MGVRLTLGHGATCQQASQGAFHTAALVLVVRIATFPFRRWGRTMMPVHAVEVSSVATCRSVCQRLWPGSAMLRSVCAMA